MSSVGEGRLLGVWLGLCAITLVSWLLGSEHGASGTSSSAWITYSALLIVAVKVRVIVVEFMEAKRASTKLQRAMDAWLLLLIAGLSAIYALKLDMPAV